MISKAIWGSVFPPNETPWSPTACLSTELTARSNAWRVAVVIHRSVPSTSHRITLRGGTPKMLFGRIRAPEDLDGEVRAWLEEAYALASG